MNILQMSLSAGVLIIGVVILRALTLHTFPKKTFLVIWGVVLCRLLLPFSIPCRFSIYTVIDMMSRKLAETTNAIAPASQSVTVASVPATPLAISFDIGKIASATTLLFVWLIGMCACMVFYIIAYVKCRREFRAALPIENAFITHWQNNHTLWRPVQIRQSDRIKAPLTYGVFRPVLLLPKETDWKDETKLKYILTHEYIHIRRFDALVKLLLTSSLCIHWFNPLVWVMYILANRDIELSCDETVVLKTGDSSAYALTLIEMEEKKSRPTPLINSFSKNAIEERITAIMKIKKFTIPAIIVSIFLAVAVIVFFATTSNAASDNTVSGKNDTSFSGNVENNSYSKLERELEQLDYIETATVSIDNSDKLLHIDLELDGTAYQLNYEQVTEIQGLANAFNDTHIPLQISIVDGPASNPDSSGNHDVGVVVSGPAYPKSTQ